LWNEKNDIFVAASFSFWNEKNDIFVAASFSFWNEKNDIFVAASLSSWLPIIFWLIEEIQLIGWIYL